VLVGVQQAQLEVLAVAVVMLDSTLVAVLEQQIKVMQEELPITWSEVAVVAVLAVLVRQMAVLVRILAVQVAQVLHQKLQVLQLLEQEAEVVREVITMHQADMVLEAQVAEVGVVQITLRLAEE
tara:strand:- start:400 stop:771 length:372 start_codon:yes stop_codon:yes gene_type:complete